MSGNYTGLECPECNGPEGIASVYWLHDDRGVVNDVPIYEKSDDHPKLTKKICRKCPNCGNAWDYPINL